MPFKDIELHRKKQKEYTTAYRLRNKEVLQLKKAAFKKEVFSHYGGFLCACPPCGVTHPDFLTLNHLPGNHWSNFKRRSGVMLWKELQAKGFPPGFNVLCYNCNCAGGKRDSGGICPHLK